MSEVSESQATTSTTATDLASYQQFALEQQAQNNTWSAEQAQKQMDFQREMSNTAHQREVADLKAAGLNPVLSANSGASVPNGAAAEADKTAAGNVGAILQQVLQAQSAREVAGMYNAATIAAATIAANASMYGSDMSYWNSEDHPKTLEEVAARLLYSDSGQTGSHAPSNSTSSNSYNATSAAAASAAGQASNTLDAVKNVVTGAANTAKSWWRGSGAQRALGNTYYNQTLKWLERNKLTISSKDLAYFKLICGAKGAAAGYQFLQQLQKAGRIVSRSNHSGKF